MSTLTCVLSSPLCAAGQAASSAAGAVSGGIMDTIASAFTSANAEMLKLLIAAWVNVPSPDLSSSSTASWLQGKLSWYVAAAAVLGLLVAAGRLAIERKPDAAKEAATGMLTTLLTIGAGVATISLLSAASDAFSTWILAEATTGGTPSQALSQLGNFTALSATGGPGLIILISVIAILGQLVQLAMLLMRSALLVVLAGVWPLAAAASMTEMGRQWYKKITAWMIAFLLFKPAASIVYAAAIKMTLAGGSELASIEGLVLIILASLTLPALMKFVVPAVTSAGSMSAGEVVGTGIAAAAGAAMIIGTAGVGAAAAGAGSAAGAGAGAAGGGAAGGGTGGGAAGAEAAGGGPAPGGGAAPSGAAEGSPSASRGSSPTSRGLGLSQLVGAMRGGGEGRVIEGSSIEGEPADGAVPA